MLHGKRVVLRAIEHADLPNYVRWLADPDVLTYFGIYQPMNLAQEEAWYQHQNESRDNMNFAVELEGRHIGGCGFAGIDARNRHAEVGLFIGEKQLWDQGLGKDTLATLVGYGFDYLNLHRIYLRVFADNLRAVHAYEQVGFRHEGHFRESEWRHGRWLDMLIMSILRPEWETRPGRPGA
jgi:RimJ/RimL family protein N-acetyltransferase